MPTALPGSSEGRICNDFRAAARADAGSADGAKFGVEHVLVVGLLQPSRPPAQVRGTVGGNVGAIWRVGNQDAALTDAEATMCAAVAATCWRYLRYSSYSANEQMTHFAPLKLLQT